MGEVKDEVKVMSPIFPRLHINDTGKGGPKAPPRNKMALYQQFTNPSQSSPSDSAPFMTLSLRSDTNNSQVPSMANTLVIKSQRSVLAQRNSATPSQLAEKLHAYPCEKVKLKSVMLDTIPQKMISLKKGGDEEVFLVSSPIQESKTLCNDQPGKNGENLPQLSSSMKFRSSLNKRIIAADSVQLASKQLWKNQMEDNSEMPSSCQGPEYSSKKDASLTLSKEVKNLESLKRGCASVRQDIRSISIDSLNGLQGSRAQLRHHIQPSRGMSLKNDYQFEEPAVDGGQTCPGESEACRQHFEDKAYPHEGPDVDSDNHSLNNSKVESTMTSDISPDHVVGVMGGKLFWEARREIINQHRVFIVQVFELHRLIKVQRIIARSPHLLLEDNVLLGKPSIKVSAPRELSSEYIEEPATLIVKPKHKPDQKPTSAECAEKNAVGKFQVPLINNDTSQGLTSRETNYACHSENLPPAPVAIKTKQPPRCFHLPPRNQWLVQVMSPSEGLVYKPYYTGPCPPTSGFVAPVYGCCGSMNLNPGSADFLSEACGVPTSHEGNGTLVGMPVGQHYPPCFLPVKNPSTSGSTVDQASLFGEAQKRGRVNELSTENVSSTICHQGSCDKSSHTSPVFSCHINYNASKENEMDGRTTGSFSERVKTDVLPLFPETPDCIAQDDGEHQTRVIKVLPYNPISATESAARIFKLIQEERKLL